ncbi:MAG TPA: triple tyrosine motif-containing protein, partial [Flavisolibacter sp.]|nr:triple tyrosine motif-containing protein [Flavisolibacter sp.]
AMSFLQQQKLHYYYKLEGLNNEWIHTDRPTAISYNYLPPNTYTFLVRTENIDGLSNNAMARLTIVINAPFWKTWWFYSLLLLAFITIWYLVDRERVNKRKMLLQVRSEIANNLHDDISTNLNDINILSEMAKIKAGKNVEQSKDFIAQISDKSSSMILAMDDMLWSINPANDSMKNTINRIKELTNGLMSGNDIDIELMLDNKLEEQELDMKLRHDIYFLYKEAVTFFAKNGQFRQIFVNLKYKKQTLMIEILSERPDQHQLDFESQLNRTLKKRAEHLSVDYHFSMEAKHTLLVLTIPLKQS